MKDVPSLIYQTLTPPVQWLYQHAALPSSIKGFAFILISSVGRLTVALAIIASTVYWWKSRGGDSSQLEGRVAKLEKEVEDFWCETASSALKFSRITTSNVLEQKISLKLKELQGEVQKLPQTGISPELETRIKSLYDAAVVAPLPSKDQAKDLELKKTPLNPTQSMLLKMNWSEIVDIYEQCANSSVEDPLKEYLNHFQSVLLSQIGELYKKEAAPELFACLLRMHGIARKHLGSGVKINPVIIQPSLNKFGGLARSGNNSCYLATALQLFRAVGSLRDKFDPAKNVLQDIQNSRTQQIIDGMLNRMDRGETISAQEGKGLQQLILDAGIIEGEVYGMYDAGEIAARLLYLMGFELPSGLQFIRRVSPSTDEEISQDIEDYRPAIAVSPASGTDVGAEIKKLAKAREELVEEKFGAKIKHVYTVSSLPEFMVVEFLGSNPQLLNVEQFDDPLDGSYKYELVFGMENTGAHWISHVLCAENQWMTANDAKISIMNPSSLSKINRGYYVRKPK